jgi:hypothetical protein
MKYKIVRELNLAGYNHPIYTNVGDKRFCSKKAAEKELVKIKEIFHEIQNS